MSETPTLDEMREQIAAQEALETEQAQAEQKARMAPYRELADSVELQYVKAKLAELRPLYLEDEHLFRRLDSAHLSLSRI